MWKISKRINRTEIRLILVMSLIGLTSISAQAQWKKLLTLPVVPMSAVYFLDLPGPPRVGFVGADYGWYKTTDGGTTWKHVGAGFPGFARGIVFKDSMTGWTCWGHYVSRTTDEGETWQVDSLPGADLNSISYNPKSGGLFLGCGNVRFTSWDDGLTWQSVETPFDYTFAPFFLNPDSGIRSNNAGFEQTTDGGKTWSGFDGVQDSALWQLYTVPGTETFLAMGLSTEGIYGGNYSDESYQYFLRSDDFWHTIRTVHSFVYNNVDSAYWYLGSNMEWVQGTFDNLFIQDRSGCWRSTDSGVTWRLLCGPFSYSLQHGSFYANGNYIYCPANYSYYDPNNPPADSSYSFLWMLNVDSMQYFPTGIQLPSGEKDTTVIPSSPVAVNFVPETSDPIGLDSGRLAFRFDSTALSLAGIKLPTGWNILDSSSTYGTLHLDISADSNETIPSPMVSLQFRTYLSPGDETTKIYLDSSSLFGHRKNCDCEALSILRPDTISHSEPDSVQVNFLLGCGDSIILAAMEHVLPFSITSIAPNPVSNEIRISGRGLGASNFRINLFDILGRLNSVKCVITPNGAVIDASPLPVGTYYLRLSAGGYVVTRSVLIER